MPKMVVVVLAVAASAFAEGANMLTEANSRAVMFRLKRSSWSAAAVFRASVPRFRLRGMA